MSSERLAFLCILLLGVGTVLAFHSSGALSERDALTITAFDGGITTSPPGPVTVRATHLGARLVQLVWTPTGIFRASHLAAGLLLSLAAALSAMVAHRAASSSDGAAWAGALLLGGAILFGADSGALGLEAGPVAILLLLLSGAAAAWTAARPHPAIGGLLLGLALADHPLILFLLPGFGAMALGATLRLPPEQGGRFLARAWIGFFGGFVAVLLPVLDARSHTGLLLVSDPHSVGDALAVWWGRSPAAWSFAAPGAWGAGFVAWITALWRNAGPLGLVLGLAGLMAFFRGHSRRVRPFLMMHALLALAAVIGSVTQPRLLAALLGWSFLFWAIPTLTGFASRRPAVAAAAAVALLFVMNSDGLNRSAEKGVAWASTVMETAPADAVLITNNPVHLTLAAEDVRPDLDVIHLAYPSSLGAFRTGRPLLPADVPIPAVKIGASAIRTIFGFNLPNRPVLVDPSVYFADESLGGTRDVRYRHGPHGIGYRIMEAGRKTSNAEAGAAVMAWVDVNVTPGTPASPLRNGLSGDRYFARALQTSGFLFVEEGREIDAERDFLLALGHPAADHTAAAIGLARIFFTRRDYKEATRTLEAHTRDQDAAAWMARKLAASAYARSGDPINARRSLERAMSLVPPHLPNEIDEMRSSLANLGQVRNP